jgi:hypothetical protein
MILANAIASGVQIPPLRQRVCEVADSPQKLPKWRVRRRRDHAADDRYVDRLHHIIANTGFGV